MVGRTEVGSAQFLNTMPRFICPECRACVQKFRRKRQADRSWICSKCKLRGSKVEMERQVAQEGRDQALEKARESSILLKGVKKKRLQLEDKITQRLCREGGYKLEGLDAAIVPFSTLTTERKS